MRRAFCAILYLVFLFMGIHAAYNDRLAVALFWAITCAGESVAVSIDYWPGLQKDEDE